VERRGKSSPAARRLAGHVNPTRSNTDRGACPAYTPKGGLSGAEMYRLDR